MSVRLRLLLRAFTSMALLGLIGGCGFGDSSSATGTPAPASAKGTILVRGKPPAGAKVMFTPSILKPGMEAKTVAVKPDGTYQLDLVAGPYSIIVRSSVIDRDPALETNSRMLEVKPGENVISIEL